MSANDELQAHTCEKAMEEYLALLYKNGELELGREYWLKTACTRLPEKGYFTKIEGNFGFYRKPKGFRSNCLLDVKKILAPVPSYEELEELKIDNHTLKAWIKNFQPKYKEIEKENQQLKELLLKCLDKLESLNRGYDVWGGELTDFIEEIDNAIGEK